MRPRLITKVAVQLLVASVAAAGLAPAASADLPRTYAVQRVDGPTPTLAAGFGGGVANVGDLNRDGSDDFALGVSAGSAGGNGQVFVFSGTTGERFDTISAPDPGGAGTASALFGIPFVGPMPDIGSCPGRSTGQLCTNPIGPKDGVPELLIGARGVDVGGVLDVGRAYVYDGATRALVKRIDMPPADRTPTAVSSGGAWFGRAVVSPAGSPPCSGLGGIGPCQPTSDAVRLGDFDGGGLPEVVVGASRYTESPATAFPTSHCARTAGATCISAGRAYVYRGEDIAGSDPGVTLETAFRTVRNPAAQADDPNTVDITTRRELFANAIAPVGDVGGCTTAGVAAGDRCPATGSSNVPDGRPEILISGLRVDVPMDNPDPAFADAGVDFLVDGRTGAVLYTYQHPEPQAGAVLGSSIGGPAVGTLGDSPLPDVYLSAVTQNGRFKAEGRGYVMSGDIKAFTSTINFSLLNDPTPSPAGDFGAGYTAVGDLVTGPGVFRNELLVGQGSLGEPRNDELLSDVHFFDTGKSVALQSIADPDQNPGSRFGADVITLGDLNSDGFLDFAVAAPAFSGAAGAGQGRLYIFRSDNSPAPPTVPVAPPAAPVGPLGPIGPVGPAGPPAAPAAAAVVAGRTIDLAASRERVRSGARITLRGVLQAFANPEGCQGGQRVTVERRATTSPRYAAVASRTTSASGAFAARLTVRRAGIYRARVAQTQQCLGAASQGARVTTVPRRASPAKRRAVRR